MNRQPEPVKLSGSAGATLAIELRHLRYFVALADAGSFTRAAERMFIAQPTLSQQIRRLEEIVGAPLLQRRRDGVRLTEAGAVLLDASRAVLSLVDQEVNRTRQAAGLGRQRLRVVVPPGLPDTLAVEAASRLRLTAAAADVEIVWIETPLDAEFSLIRQHRADAGLGWLTAGPEALPSPLDVMGLAELEPDVWIPSSHAAARRGTISLAELAHMDVIHGPRRAEPGIYDAWTQVLRAVDSRFEFSDPPLRHSLQMNLAFAGTADLPTAVLTGPSVIAGSRPRLIRLPRSAITQQMVRVTLEHRPLAATAALVWSGDLPRTLQQILFDTADSIISPGPARQVEPELQAMSLSVTHLGQALAACVQVERGWPWAQRGSRSWSRSAPVTSCGYGRYGRMTRRPWPGPTRTWASNPATGGSSRSCPSFPTPPSRRRSRSIKWTKRPWSPCRCCRPRSSGSAGSSGCRTSPAPRRSE